VPLLRTDDVVRRQRALWLGPPGHRWPFDATYVAWAVGFCAAVFFGGLGGLTGLLLGDALWPLGPLATLPIAYWVTRRLLGLVDHDRPLRYWRRLAVAEVAAGRATTAGTAPVVVRPAAMLHRRLTVKVGR
jgi:hypothetical protein